MNETMGKALEKFVATTQQEIDEFMASYPFPGAKQPELAIRIEWEVSAIKKANPSRKELIRQLAEWKVRALMVQETLPDLIRIAKMGVSEAIQAERREAGQRGAEALHKMMGTKGKLEKLREIWASGIYRTRDECAGREHENLGIGLSTARRALRNIPEPMRRTG